MDLRKTIKELLDLAALPKGEGLVGFTEDQLKEARSTARTIASYAKDTRNVDDLKAAVEAFEAINTELTDRADAQAKLDSDIAALESRITVEQDDPPAEDPPAEDPPAEDPPVEPEVVVETPVPAPVAAAVPAPDPAPATPAPATPAAPALVIVPEPTAATPTTPDAPITLTAAGDVKGYSAGMTLTADAVADAMKAKADSVAGRSINGQWPVGTLHWKYPDDRFLDHRDSTERNNAKVNAVVAAAQNQTREHLDQIMWARDPKELDALVAAGGLCAPVSVRYELFTVGTTARPLRDSLTRFGATRGGIHFNAPPTLQNLRDGQSGVTAVNIYTEGDDTASTGYPKGCIRVVCTDDTTVEVSAITLCMEVGNYSRMFNPESFNAWWGLGRVQHARIAEEAIWSRLDTLSTNVLAGEGLGASVDTLAQVEKAAAQYRDRHRIDPETPLRLRAPAFLRNIMRVDMTRRAPGDSTMSVSNGELARHFAARNIAITWILDGQFASGVSGYPQGAGAINPWPSTVDVNLSIDGTFLFLDGGSLDFGTEIRDFDQIKANDVGAFMETFENTAFVGPEAIMLTLNICPDGTTSGSDVTAAELICASGS